MKKLIIIVFLLLHTIGFVFSQEVPEEPKKEEPKQEEPVEAPQEAPVELPQEVPDEVSEIIAGDGSRRRIYLIGGTGWTFGRMEGLSAELGVEMRLFGDVHAQLMLDYYSATRGVAHDGVTITQAYGISLYALYKIAVSETLNFNIKAGGHITVFDYEVGSFGILFDTTETEKGLCGGIGFDWLLGNRWGIYTDGTLKYLMVSQPWIWVKVQLGVRFRVR